MRIWRAFVTGRMWRGRVFERRVRGGIEMSLLHLIVFEMAHNGALVAGPLSCL